MNTEEGNKLIAEFMGFQIKPYEMNESPFTKYSEFVWDNVGAIFKPDNLVYNSSWSWLMPVVEKIRKDYYVEMSFYKDYNKCAIICGNKIIMLHRHINETTTIEIVWQAVIEFIEWYNSEQSVKESDATKAT